jgi:hypothetical protein
MAPRRVEEAKRAGVRIGLGSDWSPSGSKNLLGELKVAWLYSKHHLNGLFSARDLVAMATRDAAAILKWQHALGTLETGKRADLIVIAGKTGDPYEALIKAKETDLRLVMINGIGRYGMPSLMKALKALGETLRVGGKTRQLFLEQQTGDPDVANVSLSTARDALKPAFRDLPRLALELEQPKPKQAMRALDARQPVVWSLALDEIQPTGVEQRTRLPFDGPRDFTGPDLFAVRAAAPLSTLLQSIELDPLTVADDANFLAQIAEQPNLPEAVRAGLAKLY